MTSGSGVQPPDEALSQCGSPTSRRHAKRRCKQAVLHRDSAQMMATAPLHRWRSSQAVTQTPIGRKTRHIPAGSAGGGSSLASAEHARRWTRSGSPAAPLTVWALRLDPLQPAKSGAASFLDREGLQSTYWRERPLGSHWSQGIAAAHRIVGPKIAATALGAALRRGSSPATRRGYSGSTRLKSCPARPG